MTHEDDTRQDLVGICWFGGLRCDDGMSPSDTKHDPITAIEIRPELIRSIGLGVVAARGSGS